MKNGKKQIAKIHFIKILANFFEVLELSLAISPVISI
jgi:hypothetical protein